MQEVQAPLPTGAEILERYIVQGLLGTGGFGNVYLVQDQRNDQKLFALAEVINPIEHARYRFVLEYVSLAPLDHQALPSVQYVFRDDKLSRLYVLMSYIDEPNLEILRLQQPEKRFPLPQTMAILAPVINAVTHLHHYHPPAIHQNINPANIIVSRAIDTPVLAMLNFVKEQDSTTTTLRYFAPGYGATEQYRGEFSSLIDIYGLGATCYTLLTGIVPPDALSRSTQLGKGEIDPLRPVNEVIPAISTFMDEAIQRAMSINADDRFPSVEQFWGALESPAQEFSQSTSHSMPSTSSPPPVASEQEVKRPSPVPAPVKPPASRTLTRVPRAWQAGAVFIVIALLISLVIGAGFWLRTRSFPPAQSTIPTPTVTRPTPASILTSTPVPSIYPPLAETYLGTIYDISVNVKTNMSLTGIRQHQGNISGYLIIGPNLQGSGPFNGTIDTAGHFQFIATDAGGDARLFFEGVMQSTTGLSGDYYRCSSVSHDHGGRCSQAPGSYGIWNVDWP